MAGTTELFNNMKDLRNSLEENHTIFSEKGNKAAGTRARKAAGEYRNISIRMA